jgi:PAS domain S-box-containing protein
MDRIGTDESPVELESANAGADTRPTWPRTVLAAVLPPLGALALQAYFGQMISRWSFFYPAVFLSSWIGGFGSGAAATVLSLTLVWWFLMPSGRALGLMEPKHFLAASIFVLMGFLISALQGRLRRLHGEAARALRVAHRLNMRLEKALDERRVFAALIENSSDFIGIADTGARPQYINPAGRRMVGIEPDFPVDTTRIADFYPPGRRDIASEIVNGTYEEGHWHGETRLRHWQTGADIPVSVTAFLIRDLDDDRVLGIGTITRDISAIERSRDELQATNRRLAEATEDLAENQRFLEAIMRYSPNGIVVKDLNGRYLKVNRQVERLLGMGPGEMTGKQAVDVFPGEVGERLQAEDRVVVETHAPLTTEERVDTKDGPRVFLVTKFPLLEADGTVFAVCGIWSDITDRKRAEDAMRQSASDLREAQRVAHVGSWSWDPKTDTPRLSDELYRIFGMDPSLPVPKLFSEDSEVFTPESLAALRAGMAEVLAKGKPYQLELEVVRPDGTRRWLAAHGDAVRDASGQICEITGTAQDITELKKLQQMREEWTSVIAHDLRQPIGVIASAAEFLPELHAGKMNETEMNFARRIGSAARTLARMVDDLLDLSLLEADRLKLERAWVDPHSLVRETVERLSHVTGEGRVKVSEHGKVARVFVDPMRVDQVLGNLISNAVKYGDAHAEILVELDKHDDEVELSVTNRGKGIAPEDLARIFGRFVRTKTAHGSGAPGLGVGLYIAKGLIEAHGGRMWVDSTPGQTTTFHLTLPCRILAREAAA